MQQPIQDTGWYWPLRNSSVLSAVMLGLLHAVVDFTCGAAVYSEVALNRLSYATLCNLIIAYNVLAFGSQFLVGLATDRLALHRLTAAFGMWFLALGVITQVSRPYTGIALLGIGNSFFHVGAGAIVLAQSLGRSREPGIFVGPGALGITLGLWIGLQDFPHRNFIVLLLVLAGALMAALPFSAGREERTRAFGTPVTPFIIYIVLLLASVGIRALVGGSMSAPWRPHMDLIFILAGAAVLGKIIGGILADRLGWRMVATGALVLSAPFVSLGYLNFVLVLIGMLVFQFTMPVTLSAVYLALPNRPGFAFGLPCLALLLGALPGLTAILSPQDVRAFMGPIIILSAILVFLGLRFVIQLRGAAAEVKPLRVRNLAVLEKGQI